MEIIFFQWFQLLGRIIGLLLTFVPPSLTFFFFLSFFFPSSLFLLTISLCLLSVSVLLPLHCPTHVYFDTQPLLCTAEGWPQPSVS